MNDVFLIRLDYLLMKRNIEGISESTTYLFAVGIFLVIAGIITYLSSGNIEPTIILITYGFIIICVLLVTAIGAIREYENQENEKNRTNESKQ